MTFRSSLLGAMAVALLAGGPFICLVPSSPAAEPSKKSFDLPSGPASESLQRFIDQSGAQVLYVPAEVEGIRTNEVRGRYASIEAIKLLLAGTHLSSVETRTGAIAVGRASDPNGERAAQGSDRPEKSGKVRWFGQEKPAASQLPERREDVVQLSDFVVNTSKDRGYGSTHALGGTRVNIPLLESPVSVTTVTRAFLDDMAAMDAMDALKYVSSISYAGAGTQQNVRGSSIRLDYLDGLPVNPNAVIPNWDMDLFERLEVIKGPAGTLYGAHQIGGLVNRVSKRPMSFNRTTVSTAFDSIGPLNGVYRGSIDTTGPLDAEKRLTYRLIGTFQEGTNRTGGPDDRRGLVAAVDYSLNPNSRVWFRFMNYYNSFIYTGFWEVDAGNNFSYLYGREFSRNAHPEESPAQLYNRIWFYEAGYETTLDFFGTHWSMRLVGRSDNGNHDRQEGVSLINPRFYDAAGNLLATSAIAGIFANPALARIDVNTNSVRTWRHRGDMSGVFVDISGGFETGPFRHKLITYAQTVNTKQNRVIVDSVTATNQANSTGPFNLWPTGLPAIIYSETYRLAPNGAINDYSKATAFNFAVQDNIWFWKDRLIAVLGARYDWAENDSINRVNNVSLLGRNFAEWVYKYGLVWRATEGVSLYLNHSETFNPVTGGFDDLGNPLKNEIGNNDEVGLKFDLMNNRLVATVSAFDSGVTNKLVSVALINPSTGNLQIYRIQTGHTTTQGWEADIAWQPIDAISFMGGLGDIQIKNENGIRLANGSYGMNYRGFGKYSFLNGPLRGVAMGAGYSYTNQRAGDAGDTFTLPAYGSWDALVHYARKNWSVQANIMNVTDMTAIQEGGNRLNVQPLWPRRYRVTFRYTF